MDETFERLQALDGKRVWVALLRAKDQSAAPVYRSGDFRLFDRPNPSENLVTRIVDTDGLPVVTLLGSDTPSVVGGALRVALRPTFRIDVLEQPFPAATDGAAPPMTYERATRELVAELEAGFRSALVLRPDPDPEASARGRHGLPPLEEGPLLDHSVRFAVGHASATLRPDGENGVRLTCIGSSVRAGRQLTDLFEPAAGAHYVFEPADIERLGADIRAFLSNRRERFRSYSSSA
jgi:hypothetical protein